MGNIRQSSWNFRIFRFFSEILRAIFQVFWSKSKVLGQIGRSGKVLGFISSNFGPDPTAGYLLKGNNRGAIVIIIIPDFLLEYFGAKQLGSNAFITGPGRYRKVGEV